MNEGFGEGYPLYFVLREDFVNFDIFFRVDLTVFDEVYLLSLHFRRVYFIKILCLDVVKHWGWCWDQMVC
jgi:hypothetical protein